MATYASHVPRKFIVCCDGTWLNSDDGYKAPSIIPWNPMGRLAPPSNVTRLARAIKPVGSDGTPQIVYYQAGLGSGWTLDNQLLGGALGFGLSENIREAYEYLANNHTDGDEIFLAGFSRGAFTARSVSGLMSSMGLLHKQAMKYFPFVFMDWENTGEAHKVVSASTEIPGFSISAKPADPNYQDEYMAELQRLGFTRDVKIKAIGVWDTVGALGIPITPWLQRLGFPTALKQCKFYDTALDNHIEHAFQALALDERRSAYAPCVWNKQPGSTTDLVQCWFPGVHSNVGGSYPVDGIGELTLAWMMSKLSPFLDFEPDFIKNVWADNEAYLEKINKPQYSGWGDGEIINSASHLTGLLGTQPRTPGQYHATDPAGGRAIPSDPKLDTNEHVHACVRWRVETKGTKVGGSKAGFGYYPAALDDWRVEPENGTPVPLGEAIWDYKGPDRGPQLERLPEDELGDVELELLSQFKNGPLATS